MDNKQYIMRLAKASTLDYKETQATVRAAASALLGMLKEGEGIAIPAFGTFSTQKVDEHVGIDAATSTRMLFPPEIVIAFVPSHILRKHLVPESPSL